MKSILTKNQKKVFTKDINYCGKPCIMKVTVRYDDECGNGHNSFAITGDIKLKDRRYADYNRCVAGGCIHEEIEKYFPELKHLIKWHFMNSDAPTHYIANTTYWMKNNNVEYAKSSAKWGNTELDVNPKDLANPDFLNKRLPLLIKKFKKDIENFGFTY